MKQLCLPIGPVELLSDFQIEKMYVEYVMNKRFPSYPISQIDLKRFGQMVRDECEKQAQNSYTQTRRATL